MAGPYAASNAFLLSLAAQDAAEVLEALNAGAQEIDEAFASGGYNTPILLNLLPAGDATDRITAKLAMVNEAIAAYLLGSPANGTGRKGSSERVVKDYDNAILWLDRVATRETLIAVLINNGFTTASGTGLQIVGDYEYDLSEQIGSDPSDNLFDVAHAQID